MPVPTIPPGDPTRRLLVVVTPACGRRGRSLPVIREARGPADLGLMFDARGVCGLTGYSATVFACNLFTLPPTLDQFLALPREEFDTGEEVVRAGWRVD